VRCGNFHTIGCEDSHPGVALNIRVGIGFEARHEWEHLNEVLKSDINTGHPSSTYGRIE
jgi:hypothetical protein